MFIQWTRVFYSVVITRHSNPPISRFRVPCNEFTSVWSMFPCTIQICSVMNSCLCSCVQLDIEVVKAADVPFPPPLDEGITEELYNDYLVTPPPTPETEVSIYSLNSTVTVEKMCFISQIKGVHRH